MMESLLEHKAYRRLGSNLVDIILLMSFSGSDGWRERKREKTAKYELRAEKKVIRFLKI